VSFTLPSPFFPPPPLRASLRTNTDVVPPKQGKAKHSAWKKFVDEGITAEQAQEKYVAKVEEMKTKYGYDENKEPEAVGKK